MPEASRNRLAIELPWSTILKILAAMALVWLWLDLVGLVLVAIVAVLLAVALDPLVTRLEARGLSRGVASGIVGLAILLFVGGFLWLTWASLSAQARYAVEHLSEIERDAVRKMPRWMRGAIGMQNAAEIQSYLAPLALRFAQSLMSALTITLLGFILTMYLLVEGEATKNWLVAFVPLRHRGRTDRTLVECERVIFGYVAGNVITSVIAAVCTFVALWALKVPAALLLAIMAGVSDFVPVVGFFVTLVPAVVLAMTVSTTTVVLVVVFYIAYNVIETYVISPWAYGGRLKLSNLAVILAFIIGGEVAGVIGALIALPIAAIYPSIEHIWLRDKLGSATVEAHKALEETESVK